MNLGKFQWIWQHTTAAKAEHCAADHMLLVIWSTRAGVDRWRCLHSSLISINIYFRICVFNLLCVYGNLQLTIFCGSAPSVAPFSHFQYRQHSRSHRTQLAFSFSSCPRASEYYHFNLKCSNLEEENEDHGRHARPRAVFRSSVDERLLAAAFNAWAVLYVVCENLHQTNEHVGKYTNATDICRHTRRELLDAGTPSGCAGS